MENVNIPEDVNITIEDIPESILEAYEDYKSSLEY